MIDHAAEIERAFCMLEAHGVPRERAGTVSNGIDVYATRMLRQHAGDVAEMERIRTVIMKCAKWFEVEKEYAPGTEFPYMAKICADALSTLPPTPSPQP